MIMDNKANNGSWEVFDEDQEEDTLSLCGLTMQESSAENNSSPSSALRSPRTNEFFEFSHELLCLDGDDAYHSAPGIVFCGKLMNQEDGQDEEEGLNEFQKRDYLTVVKSNSFRTHESEEPRSIISASKSLRFSSSKPQTQPSSYHHHHRRHPQVQKVNISSLTSMSAKSRRRMFMFGPVKFKPEMELSAIKERQGKRLTTLQPPPPTVLDGGKAEINDGRKRNSTASSSGSISRWGVVKSTLRCRAHLSSVLARSFVFACIPAAASGGGNWIKVANQ